MTGVQTYVGSFTPRTTTGTQDVTGIGFTPVAVVFWANYSSNPTNAWAADLAVIKGFAAYDGSYYNMGSSIGSQNNVAATNGRIGYSNAKCVYAVNSAGTVVAAAAVTAMASGQFTLNWTTAYATGVTVYYMAIGGDVTKAKIVAWQSTHSALAATSTSQSVIGVGFKPCLVMHLGYGDTSAGPATDYNPAELMFGVMDAYGNQFATVYGVRNSLKYNVSGQSTGQCIRFSNGSAGYTPDYYYAAYTSMDNDGFTVQWTTVLANAWQFYQYSLCLYNATAGEVYVGHWNKSAAAAPVTDTITTSLSGAVNGALFSSMSMITQANNQNGGRQTFAGCDGTNSACIALQDKYTSSTTATSTAQYTNETIIIANNDTETNEAVGLATFSTNQFSVAWSTNNAVAVEILYIAFGSATAAAVSLTAVVPATTIAAVTPSISVSSAPTVDVPATSAAIVSATVKRADAYLTADVPATTPDVVAATVSRADALLTVNVPATAAAIVAAIIAQADAYLTAGVPATTQSIIAPSLRADAYLTADVPAVTPAAVTASPVVSAALTVGVPATAAAIVAAIVSQADAFLTANVPALAAAIVAATVSRADEFMTVDVPSTSPSCVDAIVSQADANLTSDVPTASAAAVDASVSQADEFVTVDVPAASSEVISPSLAVDNAVTLDVPATDIDMVEPSLLVGYIITTDVPATSIDTVEPALSADCYLTSDVPETLIDTVEALLITGMFLTADVPAVSIDIVEPELSTSSEILLDVPSLTAAIIEAAFSISATIDMPVPGCTTGVGSIEPLFTITMPYPHALAGASGIRPRIQISMPTPHAITGVWIPHIGQDYNVFVPYAVRDSPYAIPLAYKRSFITQHIKRVESLTGLPIERDISVGNFITMRSDKKIMSDLTPETKARFLLMKKEEEEEEK